MSDALDAAIARAANAVETATLEVPLSGGMQAQITCPLPATDEDLLRLHHALCEMFGQVREYRLNPAKRLLVT